MDFRLIKNVEKLEGSLENVSKLNCVRYTQKADEKRDIGLIAQELQLQYPELVKMSKGGHYVIEYERLVVVLLEAVQELNDEVRKLKKLNGVDTKQRNNRKKDIEV